ncbi:MAG: asparagine synthase (glutamine-hydrolyzing) [Acidobacteria bacterium]|nr:asparagine synthase (glutamine-hydrolyzing) [Acidobacteriota bacterium]
MFDKAASRELVAQMCDVIAHRGPDDEGYYVANGVALGMRRLSIIDVATGHQPISNEDGSVWIVFNGEIYNYRELRAELIARGHQFQTRTDTEAIVHLYEDEGERCVEKLRGMFAFAIWNSRKRSLFLARDRAGKKPLHYAFAGRTLLFGSEIKSLLQYPGLSREVNLEALSDYLSFGYIPDPATAFRGIHKLAPGYTLTFEDGQVRTRCYWDFNYNGESESGPPREESYYIERLRDLLAESVRMRLESEVPLGAFLSGGIDSSTIVALMAREMGQPVKTFSIGFKESSFDELKYARLTARRFRTEHYEFVVTPDICRIVEDLVWHHDEPFADISSIPTYAVSKMAREHVTVALAGDGGDELFGGYDSYLKERRFDRYERIPAAIRRKVFRPLSRSLPRGAYGKRFLGHIALDPGPRCVDGMSFFNDEAINDLLSPEVRRALDGYSSAAAFERFYAKPASADRLDHQLYLDAKAYLPGDILVKVDRMSMANSLETRAPLLDHKLIEFVQTIPASLKLRGTETKYILKRAVSGLIPDEIIHRPKQGFDVPLKHWFNHELREMLNDTLDDQRTRQRGYFNLNAVMAIQKEHRRGRRDHARSLWGLLIFELWHRAFIDGEVARTRRRSEVVNLATVATGYGD